MPIQRSHCIKGGHLALMLLASVGGVHAQESPGSQPAVEAILPLNQILYPEMNKWTI